MQFFPATETTFLLPGPAGDLEIAAAPQDGARATAIICHPHPLHGGTMTNKVVTTIARAFHELGLRTVRFNFRGVGKSAGKYAEGIGESDDLRAVITWVKPCPQMNYGWQELFAPYQRMLLQKLYCSIGQCCSRLSYVSGISAITAHYCTFG